MPKFTRIGQFAIKQQGAIGTPATIAGTDVKFECEQDGGSTRYSREMNERNPQRTTLSKKRKVPGRASCEFQRRVELKAGGGKTTAPDTQRILLACNLAELTVKQLTTAGDQTGTFIPGEGISDGGTKLGIFIKLSGTTLTYAVKSGADFSTSETITGALSGATVGTHASDAAVTAIGFGYVNVTAEVLPFTAYAWQDGTRYRAVDAMATGVVEAGGSGELPYLNFTLTGPPQGIPDDTDELTAGVSLSSEVPQPFMGATLTVDGTSVCVDALNFDLGGSVVLRRCSSATYGYKAARVNDRNIALRIDPEAELEATFDFWTKYDTAEKFGFFTEWGASGKTIGIAAPQMVIDELQSGDREGLETYQKTLVPADNSDYDFILFFYDAS